MKKQVIYFFLFISIVSCTSKASHSGESFLTVENKIINLPEPLPLNGIKLNLEVMGLCHGFCVDSFLFVKTLESINTFTVFNIRTFEYYGDIFKGGDGPDEYINIHSDGQFESTPEGIKLWVSDNTIKKIRLININKSLRQRKVVQEKEYSYKGSLHTPFSINDSCFIAMSYSWTNLYYSSYSSLSKAKTDMFPFFNQTMTQEDIFYISGSPALKPDKTKFACAMMYLNQVLITSINGSKKFSVSIGSPQSKSEIDKTSRGDRIETFSSITADNKYIWLLYQGQTRRDLESPEIKSPPSKVLVMDWDGNPLYFFTLETNLINIFLDSNKKILYGIDQNENLMSYNVSEYSK